jgi:tetratricopeptide (TPR) repeat protein
MKAEHRHELKTNELADWIVHFPQWFEENRTSVIVGAVIIAGLIAYTIFFYSRQGVVWEQKQAMTTSLLEQLTWQKETVLQGRVQGLGVSDIFLNTVGSLGAAAEETENPLLSALAMIKKAEALRAELHYRPKVAELDVQKYQLEQAKSIYEQALAKAKSEPGIAAMAEYGIALCFEDMGDFEGAQKLYGKIADSAEYQGSSFAARAKFRAKVLSDYEEKVFFASAIRPDEIGTTGDGQVEPPKQIPEQQSNKQSSESLKLEAPMTETNIASQKDLDFNLAQ